MALPQTAGVPLEVDLQDPPMPLKTLTEDGGEFVEWTPDGKALTWSIADHVYRRALAGGAVESLAIDVSLPRARPAATGGPPRRRLVPPHPGTPPPPGGPLGT